MIQRYIRSGCLLATLAMLLFGTTACNTMEGAGKDIESAGDAIEDTARDTRKKL
ncbi:MAG: entericidin A/B family lipoprotein [Gammaproteobacteria bacterium]|nr:entericidin A/B family lipoprotein [Gammaproteobacteria bacterium]